MSDASGETAEPPDIVLRFRFVPSDVEPSLRLKALLKSAFRRHGMQCLFYLDVPRDARGIGIESPKEAASEE